MLKNFIASLFAQTKSRNWCPVCGTQPAEFIPIPPYFLNNWKTFKFAHVHSCEMTPLDTYSCGQCSASDRERLYALWIAEEIGAGTFPKGARLVHFAPEPGLSKWLRSLNHFDYVTADLLMQEADHKVDITDMSFPDNYCDFFICSHVLEHVPRDDKAMRELHRILKKGACGILMAPIAMDLETTLEAPLSTQAADRWHLFGQDDHIRLYAHDDYVHRIEAAGFSVQQLGVRFFGKKVFASLGLKSSSILYLLTKRNESNGI